MIHIEKGPEPRSLLQYRLTSGKPRPTYDDKPAQVRDDIQASVLRDQRGLCAYCMCRIRRQPGPSQMTIEHWFPQHPTTAGLPSAEADALRAEGEQRQLDWHNLLGVCPGGKGFPAHLHHCDRRKAETCIAIQPTDRPEHWLTYGPDGRLVARTDTHEADIERLGLNLDHLREQRRNALRSYKRALHTKHPGDWTRAMLERELERLLSERPLKPFVGIRTDYLRKRLHRLP